MKRWISLFGLLGLSLTAHADSRSSANYSIASEAIDSAGANSASANYANEGSAAGLSGISIAADGKLRTGYIGQLYSPVGIAITATQNTTNEGGTLQLSSWRLMDDDTVDPLPASSVDWSVASGPLDNITAEGLATTGIVYRNTSAVARADLGSDSATFTLNVTNLALDDFGAYAGDGLNDDWQVTYFGEGNSEAGPTSDADGDGQTNLAEFLAGYSPSNVASYLTTDTLGVANSGFQFRLSRVQPGTHYIFERSLDLKTWHQIFDFIPSAVSEPYVKSLPASGARSFYRVRLEVPAP